MSSLIKSLGIDRLNEAERLQLAEEIWDDIAVESPRIELTEAQKADLERRIAEDDADPQGDKPWEAIEARLRGKR